MYGIFDEYDELELSFYYLDYSILDLALDLVLGSTCPPFHWSGAREMRSAES